MWTTVRFVSLLTHSGSSRARPGAQARVQARARVGIWAGNTGDLSLVSQDRVRWRAWGAERYG